MSWTWLLNILVHFSSFFKEPAYLRISMCFLVRALHEVRDRIRMQFFDKVLYNYFIKKIVELFVQKNSVPKNWFPIVIPKIYSSWGTSFFWQFFLKKKPNTPEQDQVLVVMCPKLNSVTALLSPPPKMRVNTQTGSYIFIAEFEDETATMKRQPFWVCACVFGAIIYGRKNWVQVYIRVG